VSIDRYARHLALAGFGAAEQARLRDATALVIGAGGLGSPALLYLAAAGIGRLVVSDFDTVDITNLQRQVLFATDDVGRPKAEAAAARLQALNPDTNVEAVQTRLMDDALLDAVKAADVVLDCCDNFATRFALNLACVRARKPLVSGAAIRLEGQLAVFRLDRPGGPCYRCLWQEEAEELESCRGNGVLGPVPGVIGSLMAVEALKIASGCAPATGGKLLLYDAVENDWRSLKLERDPACPACAAEQW
jgi:molybdopterin-synthase adenylyltransferase